MAKRVVPRTNTATPASQGGAVMRIGPSWLQVVALAIAAALLSGGLVNYLNHRSDEPNSADIGFLDDMTKHHQQAISMSFSYYLHGTAIQLTTTASEIITGQSGDLAMMRNLRGKWLNEGATDGTVMGWAGMAMPLEKMPGFSSNAEFERLGTARGRIADDLFTTLMMRHHYGGIEMARSAETLANVAAVRNLAKAIVSLQTKEIVELNQWRASAGMAPVSGL